MDNSFACPKCTAIFTPQTFPFNYRPNPGAMGAGSGHMEFGSSQCPKCKYVFPGSFFVECTICHKGAAKTSSYYYRSKGGSYSQRYHIFCIKNDEFHRHMDKSTLYKDGGEPVNKKSSEISWENIPVWVWVIGGLILLVLLIHS